ncbi:hypothetical protein BYT27DRAFT_7335008 [Phlegmacium glaucopus]|nr:hypothetical protein BYT27DRAFT_7335008 [Phlegmacium glaucopus]
MPPQKSPRPKKANSMAKPKGAVRAKSGCYTCRIRRKKCDEKRIGDEGPCETCFRLKLECLGFGAKRPDWLRESSRVSAIRDKIKAHLAAQGMIKGHSGSGSRSAVQEDFLRLSDFRDSDIAYPSGSSTSESPHPRDLSEESDRPPYLSFPPTTATMRGQYDMHVHSPDYMYPHDDLRSSRCVSPSNNMIMQNSQFPEFDDHMSSVNSFTNEFSPALRSLFSARNLYHIPDSDWALDDEYDFVNNHSRGIPTIPVVYPSNLVPQEVVNVSLREYVNNVVKIQYLLGDNTILPTMIWEAIKVHDESREAVNLLSQTYSKRRQEPQRQVLCDIPFKSRVEGLQATLTATGRIASSADDAMAALHVVSLFLFDGGQGAWNAFLSVASAYVMALLENPRYHRNYAAALQACSPKEEFIVKTTIWFDVLGSITTQEQPRLLSAIRELFDPNRSHIGSSPSYSMMSPMGCENVVVWALAEASSLSCWKRSHKRRGTLNRRELVHKAEEIEVHLEPQVPLPQPHLENPHSDWPRLLASRIFRSATRLFIQSIINDDHPRVPELRRSVKETFDCITNFPNLAINDKPAIVRSTVFAIFICGSLTDDKTQRRLLSLHLQQESGSDGIGNTSTVLHLLEQVWATQKKSLKSSVPWREHLKEAKILLV